MKELNIGGRLRKRLDGISEPDHPYYRKIAKAVKTKPKPKRITAAYRARLGCAMGKKACEGKGIPPGVARYDWMAYTLFCVLDDLAAAIEEGRKP